MKKFLIALLAALMIPAGYTFQAQTPQRLAQQMDGFIDEAANRALKIPYLEQRIESFMEENQNEGEVWSIALLIPELDVEMAFGDQDSQTAASSVKLFVTGAIMENYEQYCQQYSQEVMDGLLSSTLIISDNDAATELIAILGDGDTSAGKEVVNAYCEAHGFDNSFVGIIFTGLDPDGTANGTTALDTARFMAMLEAGELAGSSQLLDWMKQSERKTKIPDSLPEGIVTANKTGELYTTENDTCLVYGNTYTYILSILIDDANPQHAVDCIHDLSSVVWNVLEEDQFD